MPEIFIKSSLSIEDNTSLEHAGFPLNQMIQNPHEDTFLFLEYINDVPILSVTSSFRYVVGERLVAAFQETLNRGLPFTINILQPQNGSIETFIKNNSSEWLKGGRYIRLLRWMGNQAYSPKLPDVTWSLDNQNWNQFGQLDFVLGDPFEFSQFDEHLLNRLYNEGLSEPLHFGLLREAERLTVSSPKSSFILLSAALEVGVKQFISFKDPNFAWIFDNLQSPPIDRLLTEYLVTLEPALSFKSDTIKGIKSLINERNNLVHTGNLYRGATAINEPANFKSADIDLLTKRFGLVRDLLYLMARYSGHQWVQNNVHILVSRLA